MPVFFLRCNGENEVASGIGANTGDNRFVELGGEQRERAIKTQRFGDGAQFLAALFV